MKVVFAVLVLSALTACHGQDPFKRESNPIRNYPRVADSIEKREGAAPYGVKPKSPGGTPYDCTGSFVINSNSPDGRTVFYFVEDSASMFEISIVNRLGDSFEVQALGVPEGAEFKLLKNNSANTATYMLAWTPKNVITGSETTFRPNITLNLKSKALSERCQGAMATETLHLLVEKTGGKPTISVTGLPQTKIKFGREFSFKIDVNDPSATEQKPPQLNGFAFDPALKTEGSIDGTAAADCNATPKLTDGKWQFSCKFISAALQAGNEDGLRGSGKTAEAVFIASAKSRASDKSTAPLKLSVKVEFEKTAPASQGQRR